MLPESLIVSFGYPALVLGTFLEGETVVIVAGFLAHQGYLQMAWVIFAAFAGTFAGDQLYFHLGRRKGSTFLARRPHWEARAARVHRLMEKHQVALILGFRFVYGLRTVTPFMIGMSNIRTRTFVLLNATGGLVWATLITVGGFLFGNLLESMMGNIRKYELLAIALIVLLFLSMWAVRRVSRSRWHLPQK